jgi:uncharacterized membrane protein
MPISLNEYLETALLGWLGLLLVAANVSLPYLLRRGRDYLKQMWPHYWIGYVLPALALWHAWIPMSKGNLQGMDVTGLWLATVAMLLLAIQATIGLLLRNAAGVRGTLQRAHFWTMAVIGVLIVTHVVLNRP